MITDITVFVPTRGRPDNAANLIKSFKATVDDTLGTSVCFGLDEDDPKLREYIEVISEALTIDDFQFKINHIVRPRLRLGGTLNVMAEYHYGLFYNVYGFLGDDHRFRTVGWDNKVRETLAELDTGLVYGNDLLQGESLPTAVFMTTDIVEILGYMVPPGLTHFYLDNFWLDLGRESRSIKYLPDVIIEHMHPAAGKVAADQGYADVNSFFEEDKVKYEEYKSTKFNADVRKLINGSPAVQRRFNT